LDLAPIGDSEAQSETQDKTQNHNFEAQSGSRWIHITTRNETPSQTQMDDFGGDGGGVGGIEHDNPPLEFSKDFIYDEKKIERPSVPGESSLRTGADLCGLVRT